MPSRIAGITVEIGGDTTKLTKALSSVNKSISSTQTALKDIDKLLKLDPTSTELLSQKQRQLKTAIDETKDKLVTLKNASKEAAKTAGNYDAWKEKYDPIQAEIRETNEHLSKLKDAAEKADKELAGGKISQEKYDSIQNEVKITEQHLKDLKDQAKAVSDEFGNPISPDEYDAIQREIIETEQELGSLERKYKNFGSVAKQQLEAVGEKVEEVGDKISSFGAEMSKKVTAPIVAIGAAAVAAFKDVDVGYDTIIGKTGATGDALVDLKDQFNDIFSSMNVTSEQVGEAIGEVNTRFVLTGDACEEVSRAFLQYADLNNTDVSSSIDTVQNALAAFNMEAKDAPTLLDVLNRTGQNTGAAVDSMAASIVSNATALQEMGLNVYESVGFLGKLETAGADSESVISGMKRALKSATEEGVPFNEALMQLQDTILNGTGSMDGLSAAYDLFGKSGAAVYQAVKNGQLDFSNLASSADILNDSMGSVENTFEATQDPADKFAAAMNGLKIVGSELGGEILGALAPAIDKLRDAIERVKTWWDNLDESQQQMIVKIGLVVAAIGPAIMIIGEVVSGIGSIISIAGSLSGVLGALCSPIGLVVAAIAGIVAIGVTIYKHWDEIKAWASEKWNAIKDAVSGAVENAKEKVSAAWEKVKTKTSEIWENVKAKVSDAWDNIKSGVASKAEEVRSKITAAWDKVKDKTSEAWSGIRSKISAAWDNIKSSVASKAEEVRSKISTAWENVKRKTSDAWGNVKSETASAWANVKSSVSDTVGSIASTISSKFSSARDTVASIFGSIKDSISSKIESAREAVHNAIEKIKSFFHFDWSLPKIKLPHFSISGKFSLSPPSIPHISVEWYKKAMDSAKVLNNPAIFGMAGGKMLGAGEAGREVVSGESHLIKLIGNAVKENSSAHIEIPIYVNGQFTRRDIIEIAREGISRKMININAARGTV